MDHKARDCRPNDYNDQEAFIIKGAFINGIFLHCKCFLHKNYSTGNYRVSAGFPCKNYRETLCILQGNPVIFTDCREIPALKQLKL